MKPLALLLALALTGCGTIRALAGPDPALAAAAPAINGALDRDSAAHPEFAPQNEQSKVALDGAVNPVLPVLPPIPLPGPWTPILSIIGALGAAFTTYKTARRVTVARRRAPSSPPADAPQT